MKEINLQNKKPDIRTVNDLEEVIFDRNWFRKTPKSLAAYFMYRGIKKDRGLRYDITTFPNLKFGNEFLKTKGHEHKNNYGEMYKVLEGEAIFLMQRAEAEKVLDVYAVKAKKGDYIVIPPDYGHVTINPQQRELKTANWSSKKTRSDYSLYEQMNGACYFYTKDGWIKNKKYKKVPKLRFEKPLKKIPRSLDFLKKRAWRNGIRARFRT